MHTTADIQAHAMDFLAYRPLGILASRVDNTSVILTWDECLSTIELDIQLLHIVRCKLSSIDQLLPSCISDPRTAAHRLGLEPWL
jgi:hypothetical protein